jgi:superfamily II DNA helicase RecQ
MNYKIFNIPIPDSEGESESLNKFLSGVRIISIQKEIVNTSGFSYWSFVIEYYREKESNNSVRKNKIDYREVLSEEDFAVFSVIRELRKQIASEESIPVYTIFTNEQLSEMVKKRVISKTALSKIPGIGEKKIQSYGERFLEKLIGIYETSGKPLQPDNNS